MHNVMHNAATRSLQSWTVSACMHALAFAAAMMVLHELPQPAERKPFTWNVSLVKPPPAPTQPPPVHSPSPPSQARPVEPAPTSARPTEVRPVVRTIEPVQPVQHVHQPVHRIVQQEMSAPKPVMQAVMPAVQTPSQHSTETQPVRHAHEAVLREAIQEADQIIQQTQHAVRRTSSAPTTSRQAVSVEMPSTPAVQSVTAVQSVAAPPQIVTAAPRTVTTAGARPVVSGTTEVAAIQSTMAPLQTPVATVAAGTTGVVTREFVHAGGAASTAHSESIRSVNPQPVMFLPGSVQERGTPEFYAQSASQSIIETGQVSEVVEERSVVPAPVLSRVPLTELPVRAMPDTKADYGWLAQELWHRVERLKRYPRLARLHGWEGKVVVSAVIKADGSLAQKAVEESSGYEALDKDALDLMKQIFPLTLKHPLGQPQIVVHVPIHYRIEQ